MKWILVGLVFGFVETWYFGWHPYPSCIEEWVCDIIAAILVTVGIIKHWLKNRSDPELR